MQEWAGVWGRRLFLLLIVGLVRPACGGGGGGGGNGNPGGGVPVIDVPNNIALSTAAGFQTFPQIVPAAGGGAFVFWYDNTGNIAAQKLTATGAAVWAVNGIAITTNSKARNRSLAAVTDGAGGSIVVWSDTRTSDASGADLYAQRVDANGNSLWTANGVSILSTLNPIEYPRAVPDGAGGAVVLGRELAAGNNNVLLAHVTGAGASTWTAGGVIIATGLNPSVSTMRMITDGAGGAIVGWDGWSVGTGSDKIYAQRVSSAGAIQWTGGGVQVCGAGSQSPDLVPDGAGGTILAWCDHRNSGSTGDDIFAQRLDNTGAPQWTAGGVAVVTRAGNQQYPRAASDGAGGAVIAFQEPGSDGFEDLYAQRVGGGGTVLWAAAGVPVCTVADKQVIDTVASAGPDGVVVVWKDFRSHTNYDLVAQRITLTGTAAWTADGVGVSIAAFDQTTTEALVITGQRIFLAWVDNRQGTTTSDCYGQVLLMDGSSTTGTTTTLPTTPFHGFNWSVNQVHGNVAEFHGTPDGAGGAIVVWRDQRDTEEGVYAQRLGSLGQPLWNPSGVTVSINTTPNINATNIAIASDAAGGAIVVWQENRLGTLDLYAQRLAPDGSLLWGPNGVPVVEEADEQRAPQLVSDGAGGVIVVWTDDRTVATTLEDLYAQRLNASGARQWNSHGVAVSAVSASETGAAILSDGAGGAFVVWSDGRNNATTKLDIFAQRIDGSGTLVWGATVPVCLAANDQSEVALASDGAGGLIVAWQDLRNGTFPMQTWAQRLDSSGVVQWTTDGVQVNSLAWGPMTLVPDGTGGVVLTYRGTISAVYSLYALRITSGGAAPWVSGGVRLTQKDPGTGPVPAISDGAGGVLATFWDDAYTDLYLQRIDAAGALQLGVSGITVSSAYPHQQFPILIPAAAGRLIAVWKDDRRDQYWFQLYAQGLDFSGNP